jgi:hypothetical protein
VTGGPLRRTGLTPDELVSRLRRDGIRTTREQMTHMLDELRASGVTEDVHGCWRLTAEAAGKQVLVCSDERTSSG